MLRKKYIKTLVNIIIIIIIVINKIYMSTLYVCVIADFTTHDESHFYGLPCPSADSLDPMDHFCTFDVYKIISKNM